MGCGASSGEAAAARYEALEPTETTETRPTKGKLPPPPLPPNYATAAAASAAAKGAAAASAARGGQVWAANGWAGGRMVAVAISEAGVRLAEPVGLTVPVGPKPSPWLISESSKLPLSGRTAGMNSGLAGRRWLAGRRQPGSCSWRRAGWAGRAFMTRSPRA